MENEPAIAVHRFGLGARPGQLQAMPSDGRQVLKEALRRESTTLEGPALPSTREALLALDHFRNARRQRKAKGASMKTGGGTMDPDRSPRETIYLAEVKARLKAFRHVDIGFVERLTLFWVNHFAISAKKGMTKVMVGSFEREAIRPHIKGRFADLLKSVTTHPAMLFYLDNNRSIGPNSKVGRRRSQGLNENLARELLELHTLGVDGGYSQEDVTETAKILTGWSFRGGKAKKDPFVPIFFKNHHEPGPKTVLGRRYDEAGEDEALALFEALASHPATARKIARKLARHFVADDPPESLIEALEISFRDHDGDLMHVYETLIDHPESWSSARNKLRTPQEWLAATVRAFDADIPLKLVNRSLLVMGHRFWFPPSPEGYEDRADAWLGGALINARLDWAAAVADRFPPTSEPLELAEQVLGGRLSDETALAMRRAETRRQAFEIMLLAPEMMRR